MNYTQEFQKNNAHLVSFCHLIDICTISVSELFTQKCGILRICKVAFFQIKKRYQRAKGQYLFLLNYNSLVKDGTGDRFMSHELSFFICNFSDWHLDFCKPFAFILFVPNSINITFPNRPYNLISVIFHIF